MIGNSCAGDVVEQRLDVVVVIVIIGGGDVDERRQSDGWAVGRRARMLSRRRVLAYALPVVPRQPLSRRSELRQSSFVCGSLLTPDMGFFVCFLLFVNRRVGERNAKGNISRKSSSQLGKRSIRISNADETREMALSFRCDCRDRRITL
jgi:hypothetical protein